MKNKQTKVDYKLFMIDADEVFCKLIRNNLDDIKSLEHLGYATNGISGFYSIMSAKPDIIMLDYILPEIDGIALLSRIVQIKDYKPYIIMFCGAGNDIIIQQILKNGANTCCAKPYSLEGIIIKVKQTIKHLDNINHPINISETRYISPKHAVYINDTTLILRKISMPPHIKGYHYFREAIVAVIENPKKLDNMMEDIYQVIAERHDSTINNVERIMRHAVEAAWNRCKVSVIEEVFGNTLNANKDKPSKVFFVAVLGAVVLLVVLYRFLFQSFG